jgi:hypothetical protein
MKGALRGLFDRYARKQDRLPHESLVHVLDRIIGDEIFGGMSGE